MIRRRTGLTVAGQAAVGVLALAIAFAEAESMAATQAPLQALPSLDIASYMGTWYQVAWIPNRFQAQCVSDTVAIYRELGDGTIEVRNRCRQADGRIDSVQGLARPPSGSTQPATGQLIPARLEVSFLPRWLRWTGLGWGDYWVIDLADDGRYAIVSEASRKYLWVLSRQPVLTLNDKAAIDIKLRALGFDLALMQPHRHDRR
jgi:apolipoprotein D and lipocalin family protein